MHAGVRRKEGQFALPVLHLWHRESSRQLEPENVARLRQRVDDPEQIRAVAGLDRYACPPTVAAADDADSR
jgi:hypothetical protein